MLTINNAQNFYFVRHGETEWNKKQLVTGQQDIPLNETGILQAHQAKQHLQKAPIRTICVSPLLRTRQTADIINQTLQCPVTVIDELSESRNGVREGQQRDHGRFVNWLSGEETPEGAESYRDFVQRIYKGLQQALLEPSPVLIVAHGGVYAAVLENLGLTQSDNLYLPNCHPLLFKAPQSSQLGWEAEFFAMHHQHNK